MTHSPELPESYNSMGGETQDILEAQVRPRNDGDRASTGLVDFLDEGDVQLTARVTKVGDGYMLVIDNPGELPLVIDHAADRRARMTAMGELIEQLEAIAAEHDLFFVSDGEPAAFAGGHLILTSHSSPPEISHQTFAVTFISHGDDHDDAERWDDVAHSWSYTATDISTAGPAPRHRVRDSSEGPLSDTSPVIAAARNWIETELAPRVAYTPSAPSLTPAPPTPGMTY